MKHVYTFKTAARLPGIDRKAAAARLGTILERDGALDPEAIIRDAQDAESPLHGAFTWSAKDALEKVHRNEAEYLTRHLMVMTIVDDKPRQVRAVVPITVVEQPEGPRRLIAIEEVMRRVDYTQQVLDEALNYFWNGRQRYAELSQLAAVFREIEKAQAARRKEKEREATIHVAV